MNIKELEAKAAQEFERPLNALLKDLGNSLPDPSQIRVSFLDSKGRKKRSDADANYWSPDSGCIQIFFDRTQRPQQNPDSAAVADKKFSPASDSMPIVDSSLHPAECDLLKALDRAES